jgi:hypothetical protein
MPQGYSLSKKKPVFLTGLIIDTFWIKKNSKLNSKRASKDES